MSDYEILLDNKEIDENTIVYNNMILLILKIYKFF